MSSRNDWDLVRQNDIEARNRLMLKYQTIVKMSARKMSTRLPSHVMVDDLESSGQLGLLDAIDKYDPQRGVKFEVYAAPRVRGAMLDELRQMDWAPRSVRAKEQAVNRGVDELIANLGRMPTAGEVAGHLDKELREFHNDIAITMHTQVQNLDMPINAEAGESTLGDFVASTNAIEDGLLLDAQIVARAIQSLDKREQLTLALHYYRGYTLAEVGRTFGVTESRACQIHTKALKEIRAKMTGSE